jgi:hypothetical protein
VTAETGAGRFLLSTSPAQKCSSNEVGFTLPVDALQFLSLKQDGVYLTGTNLHVVNGKGATETANSLGNVIIGYNEGRPGENIRSGSHMLVVGSQNNYKSWGGIVAGQSNWALGAYSSVTGGYSNWATGDYSSVTGGDANSADGFSASVTGGFGNHATEQYSTVSGGDSNFANGESSSVSGGTGNTAGGTYSSVSGGHTRSATDQYNWAAGDLLQSQ